MVQHVNRFAMDRFDRIVLVVLLSLGVATALILWRGDQVGLQVQEVSPEPGAADVSTRTEIQVVFEQAPERRSVASRFRISPETPGTLSWQGNRLIWRPLVGLVAQRSYTATLTAGAESVQGRSLKRDLIWDFATRQPQVLYISIGDVAQLYAVSRDGSTVRRLTALDDGSSLFDFEPSPDGSLIAFSLVRPDGSGVDLWSMRDDGSEARLLLTCDNEQCSGMSWSPHGRRLAYERRALNAELGSVGVGLGPSRIWLLELGSGQTAPLHADTQELGFSPRWSPDGSRLGYFDPNGGVRIVELQSGDSRLIPNQLGEMGSWSPDGAALVLVDLTFAGESYTGYLIRADLEEGKTRRITGEQNTVGEGSPAWSPDGKWLAFGRKASGDGTPTPGQQLWLMRPDGSEARPLATDADAHLGSYAWSPDGREIAYLRFPLMQAYARPEIWLITVDTGEQLKLAENGTLPNWLP